MRQYPTSLYYEHENVPIHLVLDNYLSIVHWLPRLRIRAFNTAVAAENLGP